MKKISIALFLLLSSAIAYSQDGDAELKFSGYIQTQWTWNEANASQGNQHDFSIRRGRLKAVYSNQYGEAVFQLDATEAGVYIKDVYLKARIPHVEWLTLQAGVFDRPFGYEISYSSSRRESPERSRVFQTLFPKERDLGGSIILKGQGDSFLKDIALSAGLFAGNGGQAKETDSGKDFIGRLSYSRSFSAVKFGIGASLYAGGVRLVGDNHQVLYRMMNKAFVKDDGFKPGDYAKRQYYGVDAQIHIASFLGNTSLMGEYLWGTQPGAEKNSKSPTDAITNDIFLRNFSGYYACWVQQVGKSRHSVVLKYDAYDPNTTLSGNECQTEGDVAYSTLGLGWLFRLNSSFRATVYYDKVMNEKTNGVEKYKGDWADDVFTLRVQYRF